MLNLIVLSYLVLICILGICYKHISFGWGLGDMLGYAMLFGGTIIHLALTYGWRNSNGEFKAVIAIVFLMFSIYITLKATIWRGGEYAWNGSLFYTPCSKRIKIQNKKVEKELLISMCSMEYYSKFTGNWSGNEMEKLSGELKIPKRLEQYIDYPINKVMIRPATYSQMQGEEFVRIRYFESDSLKLGKTYNLTGEIIQVVDRTPIFSVRIRE